MLCFFLGTDIAKHNSTTNRMSCSRVLLSLPLRRQTVVAALVMVTVLFIVYQFAFVAELGETNSKPHEARGRHAPNLEANNRKHPKDVKFGDTRTMMAKNAGDGVKQEKKVGDEAKVVNNAQQSINQQKLIQDSKLAKPKQITTLTFKCVTSGKQISVDKINDNYCDCPEDGSDEPRTSACANGSFECLKYIKPFPESIPSGWVNDGVCDCCDGSDEWKMIKSVPDLAVSLQKKVGHYLSPCPNQCPDAV